MSVHHDPELDDVLQDSQLLQLARLLSSARPAEPPLDEAFRTGLRRQLMQTAWEMGEGRTPWWRKAFAPPGLAWGGAAAGLLLIASVVIYMVSQPASVFNQIVITSPVDGSSAVKLESPILVAFNQPMDHRSTEGAVQIAPATNVAFSWDVNTLAVQPTSGNLAPNTQYQVTIGPTAKTATGQYLPKEQTITFVTQPPPPPIPTPSPTARPSSAPGSVLTGERLLATLGVLTSAVQWSADSSSIYFINAKGALDVVSTKGGDLTIVAPDGASSPAISPAGDRLAYIRGGKIEVLTFAAGKTAEVATTPPAILVAWAKDKLLWVAADGIYTEGANGPTQVAPLPKDGSITVISLAPDGAHAVLQQEQKLLVLDLTTAKSSQLATGSVHFAGWSPDGSQILYSTVEANVVADVLGNTAGTLPAGDASWSSQDAILLGSDTDLYQVRPDGSALTKLSNGTYHMPLWAPNGATFAFFRGSAIWTASAPALPSQPTTLDLATTVVESFMQARLLGHSDAAVTYLDVSGKQAYATGGISLLVNGDPRFSRYYILTKVVTATQPDSARFVVRLVLTHAKIDVSDFEETLTLLRDPASKQFVIDQASAGAHRDLGKGAEVVGVDVAADTVRVTFDSDLDPGTVSDGVQVLDSKGKPVEGTATYANRAVTITGLSLKPGAQYRLVVSTAVRDVLGHSVASEYTLDLYGPAAKNHPDHRNLVPVPPSPLATPSRTPTASPVPAGNSSS